MCIAVIDGYDEREYFEQVNDGEVDHFDYARVIDGNNSVLYQVGDNYNGYPIVKIYNHSVSDSVWIVVGSDLLGYFSIDINGCMNTMESGIYTTPLD